MSRRERNRIAKIEAMLDLVMDQERVRDFPERQAGPSVKDRLASVESGLAGLADFVAKVSARVALLEAAKRAEASVYVRPVVEAVAEPVVEDAVLAESPQPEVAQEPKAEDATEPATEPAVVQTEIIGQASETAAAA